MLFDNLLGKAIAHPACYYSKRLFIRVERHNNLYWYNL